MEPSAERPQSPLVVFGPDHIDTSRAEMLVQCLNDKIKDKRFKLQKLIRINEEKKKRNELMKNEKIQLTAKLSNIEQENSVREQQLQSEQARLKELQLNIQMLDDHNKSIKRDSLNEERKYDQEKSTLITKFERIKQQWTEIFKPQYEQSKVYQYLKQGDLAYNTLVQRKESLVNIQKLAYKDYMERRQEFCNDQKLQLILLNIGKYYLLRRDQTIKIEKMKEKLIELENKQKQLIESKNDKMKAWESVYTQPVKKDLMDFCLQTNIDQALTLSFNQIQQDIWSQPMTPTTTPTILTPQNEQVLLTSEEHFHHTKPTVTFQSPISTFHDESERTGNILTAPPVCASTITIIPNTTKNISNETNRSNAHSVLHLTTAIDDDDDELFSTSRRKLPLIQMEKMTINDMPSSTQAFVVSTTATNNNNNSNNDLDQEVSSISQNEQPFTQAFTTTTTTTIPAATTKPSEAISVGVNVTPTVTNKIPEPTSIPPSDTVVNKPTHSSITFQLAPAPPIPNRPVTSTTSSIQPQVTSHDVQQMLLTFSPDPSSSSVAINEEQPQPMEQDSQQLEQQQQQPTFSMASSIESMASTEDGYVGFNYNFGFDASSTGDVNNVATNGGGFTSPINFGNWGNLGSPLTTSSNDQFSAFLQQSDSGDQDATASFSFGSFNYGDLGGGTSADGGFGSFFFGAGGSPINNEQSHDGKSN